MLIESAIYGVLVRATVHVFWAIGAVLSVARISGMTEDPWPSILIFFWGPVVAWLGVLLATAFCHFFESFMLKVAGDG